jgi:hypothetical protein
MGNTLGRTDFQLFQHTHLQIEVSVFPRGNECQIEFPDQIYLVAIFGEVSCDDFAIGLAASAIYLGRAYPTWLFWWLWISYGLLFVGELRAWWIPYLFHAEPERAAQYQVMFGATHTFLPQRNGTRVNTLHVILHSATLTTLVVLGALTA